MILTCHSTWNGNPFGISELKYPFMSIFKYFWWKPWESISKFQRFGSIFFIWQMFKDRVEFSSLFTLKGIPICVPFFSSSSCLSLYHWRKSMLWSSICLGQRPRTKPPWKMLLKMTNSFFLHQWDICSCNHGCHGKRKQKIVEQSRSIFKHQNLGTLFSLASNPFGSKRFCG